MFQIHLTSQAPPGIGRYLIVTGYKLFFVFIPMNTCTVGCSDLVLFFRFYHMLVFHELDLLVLRPFVKCMRGKVFIFKKLQGP